MEGTTVAETSGWEARIPDALSAATTLLPEIPGGVVGYLDSFRRQLHGAPPLKGPEPPKTGNSRNQASTHTPLGDMQITSKAHGGSEFTETN